MLAAGGRGRAVGGTLVQACTHLGVEMPSMLWQYPVPLAMDAVAQVWVPARGARRRWLVCCLHKRVCTRRYAPLVCRRCATVRRA